MPGMRPRRAHRHGASETVCTGRLVGLEHPAPHHGPELTARSRTSRALHGSWLAAPSDDHAYGAYLDRLATPGHYGFVVRELTTQRLAGVVNLNNVILGALRSGALAYYALEGSQGRGLLTEAVALVVDHAFDVLGLHRVEANVQPGNHRSQQLVRRLGFRLEGFSPAYLFIDGDWRDHDRFALTAEDPRPSAR